MLARNAVPSTQPAEAARAPAFSRVTALAIASHPETADDTVWIMRHSSEGDLLELEEFHRVQLADARSRYEQERTEENKKAYRDALHRFADLVMRGKGR